MGVAYFQWEFLIGGLGSLTLHGGFSLEGLYCIHSWVKFLIGGLGVAYFQRGIFIGGLVLYLFLDKVFHWWACTAFIPRYSFLLVDWGSVLPMGFLIGGLVLHLFLRTVSHWWMLDRCCRFVESVFLL